MRLDLDAPHTSAAVRALLWAAARELRPGAPPPTEAAILTVLSTFKAPSFVPLPPLPATAGSHAAEAEAGCTQLTAFPEGLAAFAGVTVEEVRARLACISGARSQGIFEGLSLFQWISLELSDGLSVAFSNGFSLL